MSSSIAAAESPGSSPGAAAPGALDALYDEAYRELRRLAHARLRGGGRSTVLDTTALVHESYLRLARQDGFRFIDKPRFMAYAGRVMRSVIIDLVRERQAERHGGEFGHVRLDTHLGEVLGADAGEHEILRVHEAIEELQQVDARMARVVELRYFVGLSEPEISSARSFSGRPLRGLPRSWTKNAHNRRM